MKSVNDVLKSCLYAEIKEVEAVLMPLSNQDTVGFREAGFKGAVCKKLTNC